jgi:hypothetical protein
MISFRALAIAAAAMACVAPAMAQQPAPGSADLILGKPYTGPKIATPRDKAGKPVLTGYWKLVHEPGKPDGNLGKDLPGFALPFTAAGKAALEANYKTVDPEALHHHRHAAHPRQRAAVRDPAYPEAPGVHSSAELASLGLA